MNITNTASSYPQPSEAVTHNDLCYNFTVSSVDPRVLQIAHLLTTFSVLDVGTSPDPDTDPDPDLSTAGLPSELISADMARLIETVVQAGILPVLVLWGLTTNLIDMVVFRRQGLNDRINIGLFSLALSDSGYLLMVFSSRVYSLLSLVDSQVGQFWKARSLVFVGLYTGFLNVSNVLTLLVSIDRCVCVVRPLKAKGLISARSTAKLVVVVFFVCLMCCGLACFKYDVITHVDPSTNVTSYRPTLTPFYRRHRDVIDAVFQYTMNVAVPTLSLLGVTVATSVIAVHMRRSLTWRKQATKTATTTSNNNNTQSSSSTSSTSTTTSTTERRELSLTRMLVMVCVVYALCTLPTVTLAFVRNLLPGFLPGGRHTRLFYVSNCLMHLLSCVNSSFNFLIYYSMGSRFRATLLQLLGRPGRKRDGSSWGRGGEGLGEGGGRERRGEGRGGGRGSDKWDSSATGSSVMSDHRSESPSLTSATKISVLSQYQ